MFIPRDALSGISQIRKSPLKLIHSSIHLFFPKRNTTTTTQNTTKPHQSMNQSLLTLSKPCNIERMRPSTSDFLSPEAAAEYIRTAAHLGATERETAVAGATPLAVGTRKTAGLATRDAWAAVRINAVRNIFFGLCGVYVCKRCSRNELQMDRRRPIEEGGAK